MTVNLTKTNSPAVGDISLSAERSKVATPSEEIWKELNNVYYSKKAAKRDIYWLALLAVFDTGLWIAASVMGTCVFVCLLIVICAMSRKAPGTVSVTQIFDSCNDSYGICLPVPWK